jgi:hypothetical protein
VFLLTRVLCVCMLKQTFTATYTKPLIGMLQKRNKIFSLFYSAFRLRTGLLWKGLTEAVHLILNAYEQVHLTGRLQTFSLAFRLILPVARLWKKKQ